MHAAIFCRERPAPTSTRRRAAEAVVRSPLSPERRRKNVRMYIHGVAAVAAALLMLAPVADAQETDADSVARGYFERACADKVERVAVYAPDVDSLSDITTGASSGTVSWDRFRFEQLCARPELYVYHCHTTDDVLTRFPSGSTGSVAGDFGNAAEMEFTCAEAAARNDHALASLVHGLVTPRGEVIKYGFTGPTLDKIHERGREFGRMLKEARPRSDLERAQAEAQHTFSSFNAEHFDSFIQFAIKTCPSGDIEHCKDLTVERFASTLPGDDWRFIRVANPVSAAEREPAAQDKRISGVLEGFEKQLPSAGLGGRASFNQMSSPMRSSSPLGNVIQAAQVPGSITELTPETLGAFVSDGKVIVSICAKDAEGLLPCQEAKARISRLAASCGRVKTGILDQDKYPPARYIYPAAKNRSLLLFKTNPQSGLNEQFDLTIRGEPTPQMIGMTLCDQLPLNIPSFAQ